MHRFLFILILAASGGLPAAANMALAGTYTWGKKAAKNQTITATMTPGPATAEGAPTWTISFDARWKGKQHRYSGQLTGDATAGTVTGTAADAKGKRTWRLTGQMQNGSLVCKHYETTKGKDKFTGEVTLGPAKP